MNVFKLLLLAAMAMLSSSSTAQNTMGSAIGEYSVYYIPVNRDSIDSIRKTRPVRSVDPIYFQEYNSSQSLKLKWNRRFKITNDSGITDLGLNTDNPTIYGRYTIKNDTLTLKYHHTIQHFNKLAEERRVKTKFKQKDRIAPVKRFARIEKDTFQIFPNGHWKRKPQ
ncbi:MAG: hypothetical protein P8P74_02615 [Crocinitomicaceae bacterium]|nr:hypothetical protein [Crocinitomicaceae bacterium]